MADPKSPGARRRPSTARKPAFSRWSARFLSELAATSNVTASAKKAGVTTSTAYEARRLDPAFSRAWQDALCEGYDHLEMALLHRLRTGELKPGKDAKRASRAFDNATALRLLAAHRASAALGRAARDNADADAILAAIDAKLDRMRQRAIRQASPAETPVIEHEPDAAEG